MRAFLFVLALLLPLTAAAQVAANAYSGTDATARAAADTASTAAAAAQSDATIALGFARDLSYLPRLTAAAEVANTRAAGWPSARALRTSASWAERNRWAPKGAR